MRILVLGGGGREHALVWSLRQSARVTQVLCAPGNAGIAALARCLPLDVADVPGIVRLAVVTRPDLVVVGPEVPLAAGAVDALQAAGVRVFGPTQAAAQLESSKAFAKDFMRRHDIPTARYAVCQSLEEVQRTLPQFAARVVVKADGLAAGKGVVLCENHAQAVAEAEAMFSGKALGAAAGALVLEEWLEGPEVSFFALCDGVRAVTLAMAQDHKRVGEGDTGPNTGGMGAYSTDTLVPPATAEWMRDAVAQRVVDGMAVEGRPFRGVLFTGFMLTPEGPRVLEFNTRFGDPETEAILLRLESDLAELLDACVDGHLDHAAVHLRPGASACVVAASGGYPGSYATGKPITGLTKTNAGVEVFHAGTALRGGETVTAGGRVLAVSAAAPQLSEALEKIFAAMAELHFEGMQFRRDIGHRALRR